MVNSMLFQSSLTQLVDQITAYLPRLLTAALILALGWFIARLLGSLARRLAARVGLDRLAERSGLVEGLAQVQITRPLSDLIGWLIFWLIFLSVGLISLEWLGLAGAVAPLQRLIEFLPRVLAAILVMIVGAALARFMERTTQAAAAGVGIEFHQVLGRAVRLLLLVATVVIAVDQLGFDVSLFTDVLINLVTIAAAGLALTFALGGREIARNVLAGFYARDLYFPGDRLVISEQEGTLEAIGTLNCEFSVGVDRLVLPNSDLTEKQVRVIVRPSGDVDL